MNATEKKYAVSRLVGVESDARHKLDALCYTKSLNDEQIVRLIIKGKVKPKAKIDWPKYGSPNLSQIFNLDKYKPKSKVSVEQVKKRKDVINRRLQSVKDEIMLGDSESAIKALASFEVFCRKA